MDARLSARYVGATGKRLALVETVADGVSNQHELNAGLPVRKLLGDARIQDAPCRYVYIDGAGGVLADEALSITYYDSRLSKPRAPEFRLTYPATSRTMTEFARAGDLCWLLVGAHSDPLVTIVVCPTGTSDARRLDALFGTELQPDALIAIRKNGAVFGRGSIEEQPVYLDGEDLDLLALLGVEVRPSGIEHLDAAVAHFGGVEHPSSAAFAAFARSRCETVDPRDDPDNALLDWFTFTFDLYLAYEAHVLQPILDGHFANQPTIDVAQFFSVAKRLQNSRFSRAGGSFEAQLAAVFDARDIRYSAQSRKMPDGSKPDFLLPSREHYNSNDTAVLSLVTFVGAKTTTKERWQQLVAEAQRIGVRHMVTMDKDLNGTKVHTMKLKNVVPVLPSPLIVDQYGDKDWKGDLMSVGAFVEMAEDRQRRLGVV